MARPMELREAILSSSMETSNFGEAPDPKILYLPPAHLKALRLDAGIVVGGRGVGKSFWTSALRSQEIRRSLSVGLIEMQGLDVSVGFSGISSINDYPSSDVFLSFLRADLDSYDIWRAVIARWIAKANCEAIPNGSWHETVEWIRGQPEQLSMLMENPRNWRGMILFDALDRTSSDWRQMDEIVRGLLRAVLWLKSFPGLYAKVFLREDQAERTVFNFPDSSKLLATKAELSWYLHDLHGLLWQRLINAPGNYGKLMRSICSHSQLGDHWVLNAEMKFESEAQRAAFSALAGPWMGRDRRRGVPYKWAVGHLADGRGRTSPRSFLAAIRQAAEDTQERYPSHEYALHFESIKRGIQKASEIRVQEIAEDYPWAPGLLSTLSGMNVPVDYQAVEEIWKENFPEGLLSVSSGYLSAQHEDRGWIGIRDDLQRLGLIEMKKDSRLDMPDLYRVGFGLGRKGGVKPRN